MLKLGYLPVLLSGLLFAACVESNAQGAGGGAAAEETTTVEAITPATVPVEVTSEASPSVAADEPAMLQTDEEHLASDRIKVGKSNDVSIRNTNDGRLRVRTNLQFNRIEGDTVTPVNTAFAAAECVDCQAIAVAVQISVYERGASVIAPRNTALAVNDNCTRCTTVARAIQYVIPVDDVDAVPDEVDGLVRAINKEAHYFDKLKDTESVDPAEVEARLQSVMAQFVQLDQYLTEASDTKTSDETTYQTPTPSVSATPTDTPTPSPETPAGSATSQPLSTPAQFTPTPTSSPWTPTPVTPQNSDVTQTTSD